MPNNFTSTTFSDVYKDDFADSDGYYRILFNSGRPLQARELTQLQTIIQEQIKRFAESEKTMHVPFKKTLRFLLSTPKTCV